MHPALPIPQIRVCAILCHGLMDPIPATNHIANLLEQEHIHTHTIKWSPKDLPESLDIYHELICTLSESYDHLVFIGHSFGTLIGRALIQVYGSPIDSYISIDGPHDDLAWTPQLISKWLFSKCIDLHDLNQAAWPPEVSTLFVSCDKRISWLGGKILGQATGGAHLDQIEKRIHISIPGTNHLSVVFDYRTFGEIYSWLIYSVLDRLGIMSSAQTNLLTQGQQLGITPPPPHFEGVTGFIFIAPDPDEDGDVDDDDDWGMV